MPGLHSSVRLSQCILLVAALVALAGCQVTPRQQTGAGHQSAPVADAQLAQIAGSATKTPARNIEENRSAESIRVFLADTRPKADWFPVHLRPSGVLYVKPDPVIDRRDLIGIQSATDQAGGGILVLILGDEGFRKMRAATTANPGLRLALVVGQTMLAAPGYMAPVSEQQLAFGVGSERNAQLAARAVAGVQ